MMAVAVAPRTALQSCDSLFFEDNSGLLEQTARLLVSIITFLLPNWAVLYVFYLLPRFQFATTLDIPELVALEEDERVDISTGRGDADADDDASYHLLGGNRGH